MPSHKNQEMVKRRRERAQAAILVAMAKGATVTEAAQAANVSRRSINNWVKEYPEFKAAFIDAEEQGTDVIEAAATRRAVDGVEEPVIYQGQVTFVGVDKDGNVCDPRSPLAVKNVPLTIKKPSDLLAIFLLKGRRPKKFRDNVDVTSGDKPIVAVKILRGVSMDDV